MLYSRGFNLFMAFICHELLVAAYYFQYVEGMAPCPLCIFQRIGVLMVGLLFLWRGVVNPNAGYVGSILTSLLTFLAAAAGAGVAGRHVWLQNLPEGEVPACGPALEYLVDVFSWTEVVTKVLQGDGECAKVSWSFGLSMPGWMLVIFCGFAVIALLQLVGDVQARRALWRR